MKRMHQWVAGGITFLVSVSLTLPSSFAAKALDDAEMDQATAKGQSAVFKGTGNQIIKDQSQFSLEFKDTVGTDETIHNLPDYQHTSGGVVYPEGTDPECLNCGQEGGGQVVQGVGPQTQALDNKQKTEEDDVLLNENGVQANAVAGNLINAVGENNIAATVNAASSGGGELDSIDQANDIDQSKAAYIDRSELDIKETLKDESKDVVSSHDESIAKDKLETKNHTSTYASDKAKTETEVKSATENETWTESFPANVTITGTINSDATANSNGDATSTSDAQSISTSTSTADASNTKTETDTDTDTKTVTITKTETETKNINIDKTLGDVQAVGLRSQGGYENGGSRGSDGGVDVSVDKDEEITDSETTTTDIHAKGVAAIAQSDAEGHEQAYASSAAEGQAKAEADAEIDIDLPKAKSGTYASTYNKDEAESYTESKAKSETCASSKDESFTKTESSTKDEVSTKHETRFEDKSNLNIIQGDHVKLGDGEQSICLETEYDMEMEGNAQGSTRALNIINAVGRNNIAAAWNLASSAGGSIDVSPFVASGAPVSPGSIHQVNIVKQVN